MGKIVISENVSVDGVIEDPTGEGDLGRGSWFACVSDRDREEWAKVEVAEALAAEALLMGRGTYDWFVKRGWPDRPGVWADRLRSLPKHVVSSSAIDSRDWGNETILSLADIPALKRRIDGDIVVYGSSRLTPALLAAGLVDELRLMTYPVVVGAGRRLFGETSAVWPVRLVSTRTVGDSLACLTYQRAS
jgi:dihydrofolate reductase